LQATVEFLKLRDPQARKEACVPKLGDTHCAGPRSRLPCEEGGAIH
jgi:hypothetical protein